MSSEARLAMTGTKSTSRSRFHLCHTVPSKPRKPQHAARSKPSSPGSPSRRTVRVSGIKRIVPLVLSQGSGSVPVPVSPCRSGRHRRHRLLGDQRRAVARHRRGCCGKGLFPGPDGRVFHPRRHPRTSPSLHPRAPPSAPPCTSAARSSNPRVKQSIHLLVLAVLVLRETNQLPICRPLSSGRHNVSHFISQAIFMEQCLAFPLHLHVIRSSVPVDNLDDRGCTLMGQRYINIGQPLLSTWWEAYFAREIQERGDVAKALLSSY